MPQWILKLGVKLGLSSHCLRTGETANASSFARSRQWFTTLNVFERSRMTISTLRLSQGKEMPSCAERIFVVHECGEPGRYHDPKWNIQSRIRMACLGMWGARPWLSWQKTEVKKYLRSAADSLARYEINLLCLILYTMQYEASHNREDKPKTLLRGDSNRTTAQFNMNHIHQKQAVRSPCVHRQCRLFKCPCDLGHVVKW